MLAENRKKEEAATVELACPKGFINSNLAGAELENKALVDH